MKIISHQNQIEAGCFDVKAGIEIAEKALKLYHKGDIIFPDKVSQIFNEEDQTRINCLPATIKSENVCGMKWVAVFPPNPIRFGLPNLNATILLSEINSGYPIAFMDGTLCSNIRTASVSAVAAKYLASKNSKSIGFIGTGEQAKTHLLSLYHVLPSLKICKVSSRRESSVETFINQMKQYIPEMEFINCGSRYQQASEDSDVVVTAISGQAPILQAEWLKDGVFYNHVGGWEDDYKVPKIMNKIVCDDWASVKHRTQTLSRLYKMGELSDGDIYADLYEIVGGDKKGRETEIEKIYFNPVGLSYVDIALAKYFYDKVTTNNEVINTLEFPIYQKSIFDVNL